MQSALLPNYLLLPLPATANPLESKTPNLIASVFSFSFNNPKHFSSCSCRPHVLLQLQCSSSNKLDSAFLPPPQDDEDDEDEDEDDGDSDADADADGVVSIDMDMINIEDIDDVEIKIEIEKTGNNCRRIQSEIGIEAPLNTVWNLLTDYERLADFIPGLAVCRLLHKTDNYARLFQIGQQNLAFGLKFNAKGIVDCYETPLESLPNNLGDKREIEFNMVEGDFEIFQGKWSLIGGGQQQMHDELHTSTTLSYLVHVKPKLWLPVRLVESRLCTEIKLNLASIRQQALKLTHHNTLRSP